MQEVNVYIVVCVYLLVQKSVTFLFLSVLKVLL